MGARKYSNAEKAAMLLMGLGDEVASEVLRNLTTAEIRKVMISMNQLGKVDADTMQQVMREFQSILSSTKTPLKMSLKLPQFENRETNLPSIEAIDAEQLARLLQKEQEQTIALVLAHTDSRKAAECLKHLPANMHTDIVKRIATLEYVDPEILHDIDQHLQQEIQTMSLRSRHKLGGTDKAAAILNALDNKTESSIATQLSQQTPDLYENIRQKMFTFEDFRLLDPRSMQELLKNVSNEQWKVALRGTSEALRNHIFANLSQRAATMLREDMESMSPMKASEVRAMQTKILETAQKLAEVGRLNLSKKSDEYV